MPVAYTTSTVSNQWTPTLLMNELDTHFVAMGYTQKYKSGGEGVYEIASPSPTKKAYLKFWSSAGSNSILFNWAIGDSWTSGTTIGNESWALGSSTSSNWSITWGASESVPFKFEVFNSAEVKGVSFFRSDQLNGYKPFVGLFFPSEKPQWHVSNSSWMYGFITRDSESVTLFRSAKGQPWDNTTNQPDFPSTPLVDILNANGQRDFIRRVVLYKGSSPGGIAGVFSSDFAITNGSGVPRGDQVVINGETWSLVGYGGNSILAIRIA